ncbi:MAG: hypothetical protein ACOYL6_11040 [Bacteriovoracaceae bacterium]
MKIYLMFLMLLHSYSAYSEDKVIYQYKDYERIDLGDFSIQGDIITPGDLSVKERKNQFLNSDLYERENFQDLTERLSKNFKEN